MELFGISCHTVAMMSQVGLMAMKQVKHTHYSMAKVMHLEAKHLSTHYFLNTTRSAKVTKR